MQARNHTHRYVCFPIMFTLFCLLCSSCLFALQYLFLLRCAFSVSLAHPCHVALNPPFSSIFLSSFDFAFPSFLYMSLSIIPFSFPFLFLLLASFLTSFPSSLSLLPPSVFLFLFTYLSIFSFFPLLIPPFFLFPSYLHPPLSSISLPLFYISLYPSPPLYPPLPFSL